MVSGGIGLFGDNGPLRTWLPRPHAVAKLADKLPLDVNLLRIGVWVRQTWRRCVGRQLGWIAGEEGCTREGWGGGGHLGSWDGKRNSWTGGEIGIIGREGRVRERRGERGASAVRP